MLCTWLGHRQRGDEISPPGLIPRSGGGTSVCTKLRQFVHSLGSARQSLKNVALVIKSMEEIE
jgi:hypothetical protein